MDRHILLVGLGQLGCAVADAFAQTKRREDDSVHVLAIDTDAATEESVLAAPFLSLAYPCRVADVLDTFDTELLKPWFPCDRDNDCIEYFEMLSMNEGSHQWRMKAMLSLYYFLSKHKNRARLDELLQPFFTVCTETDPSRPVEILLTASLAGGTGSALFLPLAFYFKRLCAEHGISSVHCRSLLVLPDVCEELMTPEQRVKARANAYASLRELNAITKNALELTPPFPFRIGAEEDPVFGLLYDAENPAFRTKEALPFEQIFLYRRLPGVHSLTYQISFLSDCIRSLCAEELPAAPESDAIFGGISLTKTIYPYDDVVSYIAKRRLCEITDRDWLPFYKKAQHECKIQLAKITTDDETPDPVHAALARAVNTTVSDLHETDESYATLLARQYNDSSLDSSPQTLLPNAYVTALTAAISNAFRCAASDRIEAVIKENTPSRRKGCIDEDEDDDTESEAASKRTNPKNGKIKEPLFGREQRRKNLVSLAATCYDDLQELYRFGQKQIGEVSNHAAVLTDSSSSLSLENGLLRENGKVLHPVYALARLSALYAVLEQRAESRRSDILKKDRSLTPDRIPEWVLEANAEVHMLCRYDDAGKARFSDLLTGVTVHAGGKFADTLLFCYDLEESYTRIRVAYEAVLLEAMLPIIGKKIDAYLALLKALSLSHEDQELLLDEALHRASGRLGTVYHTGASPEEKQTFYRGYAESMADTPEYHALVEVLDQQLAERFLTLSDTATSENMPSEAVMEALANRMTDTIRRDCLAGRYYRENIEKGVLDVLLHQDGKGGADSATLALSRAFSPGTEPLIYTIPDSNDAFLISRKIHRDVIVYLPISARDYLETHADEYQNRSPITVMEDLLFRVGEYESSVAFTDSLPANELRVLRKTSGLMLSLLEVFSENSEMPLYYKAYRKALAQKSEQCTALWDPHLICGIADGDLPPVSLS